MKRAIAFLLCALFLAGCATKLPSVCDNLTDSRLCDLSKKMGVRIEDVGNGLIIANAVAIGQGVYTKAQAVAVLREIRAILDNPVSYATFKAGVYGKLDQYPGLLMVAEGYFQQLGGLTQTMLQADRTLIVGFLDQQIKIMGG